MRTYISFICICVCVYVEVYVNVCVYLCVSVCDLFYINNNTHSALPLYLFLTMTLYNKRL